MKKLLKFVGFFILAVVAFSVVTCSVMSKSLPEGEESPRTDVLISEMWEALDKDAWDSTRYVKWSFRGKNHYHWDKENNLTSIRWGKNHVLLNPDMIEGLAFKEDNKVEGAEAQNLIDKAWSFWCNDMFWLTAPFKVKDAGTTQELITEEQGERLKITYGDGGVTPGDTYIWKLNEKGIPESYEMYVKIIPIKGISVPWDNWVEISTGAKLSSGHTIAGTGLKLENIAGGMNLSDIGLSEDIWKEIRK